MNTQSTSGIISTEVLPFWIMWSYVEAYQSEGAEFKGAN